ncbi:hypothetical protein K1T71_012247 [Dendrolimus kikuchii]|uniref:Uncharacterized protein n=1 Tax=Dendrolimus kikuchii TaxID=765133 RepID=A0ACC1CL05_9NEOP|nr:hypothetical protein K1T71_012247 [Dendrolimus kikuchii]
MCEKRTRKIKKGSQVARLREARRLQRIQRLTTPPMNEEPAPVPCPQVVDKAAQKRVILELAWKTVALMQKNRLIQQKIIALQKETSEFIASVMNNPENRQRYLEHARIYGVPSYAQMQPLGEPNNNLPLKLEPNV